MIFIKYAKIAFGVALACALSACNPAVVADATAVSGQPQTASVPATAQNAEMDQFISGLISKMTIEEKAGMMFINGARGNQKRENLSIPPIHPSNHPTIQPFTKQPIR